MIWPWVLVAFGLGGLVGFWAGVQEGEWRAKRRGHELVRLAAADRRRRKWENAMRAGGWTSDLERLEDAERQARRARKG